MGYHLSDGCIGDLPSPTIVEGGPSAPGAPAASFGVWQAPQPRPGWRPVVESISFTVRGSSGVYDVSVAPAWLACWLPPPLQPRTPNSQAGIAALLAAPNLAADVIFFAPAAPDPEAAAIVRLTNGGRGYPAPLDRSGRWWGLLAGAISNGAGLAGVSVTWGAVRWP